MLNRCTAEHRLERIMGLHTNGLIQADWSMDAPQLLQRYAEGQRDFSWADLRRADLRGVALPGINLYRADLTGADLEGADLRQASFLKANLTKANLSNANLAGANLRRADLTRTNLTTAVLDGVQFSDLTLPQGLPAVPASLRQQSSSLPPRSSAPSQSHQPQPSRLGASYRAGRSPQTRRPMRSLTPFSRPQTPPMTDIPLPSLALLWAGYCCFGSILGIFEVSVILWFLVWATALIWMLGESMAWFMPVLAAIAVMLGSGLSAWSVMMAGSVTLGLLMGLLLLNWSLLKALKDSLWIGGIVAVLINLGLWMVRGEQGVMVLSGYFPLVFLLLFGMGSSGMGAIAWLQMRSDGFHNNQIAYAFGGFAALGLFSGGAISGLLLPS